MSAFILATRGHDVARAECDATGSPATSVLADARARCLAAEGRFVFAGGDGVHRSTDAGATWSPTGLGGREVASIACRGDVVLAGLRPAGVAVSRDGGATWEDAAFASRWWWWTPSERPFTPYVQALAILGPDTFLAGVEVGGVWRTGDGGRTWSRAKGAILDCHALAAHGTDPNYAYQGGAGVSCGALSRDGGVSWSRIRGAGKHRYGWAVAGDPADPEVSYHSASTGPRFAHGSGDARAVIARAESGVVTDARATFASMPYALIPDRERILAACADGVVMEKTDPSSSWMRTRIALGAVDRAAVLAGTARAP